MAEDYSKAFVPLNYQIQSKIEGQDLGVVFFSLNDEQLKAIAKEVAGIFKKVKTPSNPIGLKYDPSLSK